MPDRVELFTDGACRSNPGPGAIGFIITEENNNELESHAECIGEGTSNRAEYLALIKGLYYTAKHTTRTVTCCVGSKLVINQIKNLTRGEFNNVNQS